MYEWMAQSHNDGKTYTSTEQRQYFSFNLYSTYLEAYLDTNAWNSCSGGTRYGFPGFCGKRNQARLSGQSKVIPAAVFFFSSNVVAPVTNV